MILIIIIGVVRIGLGIGIGLGLHKNIPEVEIGYALIAGAIFSIGIIDFAARLIQNLNEFKELHEIEGDEIEEPAHIVFRKPDFHISNRKRKKRY